MTGFRVPSGGDIRRNQPVRFTWQGEELTGLAGDTLASALLAAGKLIVGRSFKYHRPRGLMAAGLDEANAIVQLEEHAATIPNLKATYVELYEGLSGRPVNASPSAEFDFRAVNSLFKRFIPAAFYYKTFMWPRWGLFEPSIRKAAGLGRAPDAPDPDRYDRRFAHCDVLVVGGGIAGLAAALEASRRGDSVILATGGAHWGGRLAHSPEPIEGSPANIWIMKAMAELERAEQVTLLRRTLATGYYDHNLVALCERLTDHVSVSRRQGFRQRLWKVRARSVVLATGAIERPLVFDNNDRPGVMLAGAAVTYLRRFGVAVGHRVVVACNNDSGWRSAFALSEGGVEIAAIVDLRRTVESALAARAGELRIPTLLSWAPLDVRGRQSVNSVLLGALEDGTSISRGRRRIACDALLVSGGWSPVVHLHSQAGGALEFESESQSFVPAPAGAAGWRSIGGATGDFGVASTLASARGVSGNRPRFATKAAWFIAADGKPSASAWIDFQNDVTAADVALAARENYRSVEHLKRYTTLGMASDQGKTSNVNGIGALSAILGRPIPAIGTTRFRPPYDPTTIGVFAGDMVGDMLRVQRQLSAIKAHQDAGAVMEEYGVWQQPALYLRSGESPHEAINREVMAARSGVGLFEASTLGKIEMKGPDAAEFLDRVYVNRIGNLAVGRCRYGLMLTEHGVVFDDGVVARLAEDHFLVGTTSANVTAVAEKLQEWLQCEWPQLRVLTEDVTTCWAVINLVGPKARTVLERLECDVDLANSSFPHMAVRTGHVMGRRCRIQRVSFTGELSYEIATSWDYGATLWEGALKAGAELGITPFGIEAMMTMRIEKGYLHIGSETDGTTLPQDVGFERAVLGRKTDFIGRRSLTRPDALREDRRQFVGLEVIDDGDKPLQVGAHILPESARPPARSQGWVTSSTWSPTLRTPLALAVIDAGRRRMGEIVGVWDLNRCRRARIVATCRFDEEGVRMHG